MDSGGKQESDPASLGQLMTMQGRLQSVERQLGTAFAQISNLDTGGLSLPQMRTRVERAASSIVEEKVAEVVAQKVAEALDGQSGQSAQTMALMTTLNGALAKRVRKVEAEVLDSSMHDWVLQIVHALNVFIWSIQLWCVNMIKPSTPQRSGTRC